MHSLKKLAFTNALTDDIHVCTWVFLSSKEGITFKPMASTEGAGISDGLAPWAALFEIQTPSDQSVK